LGRGNYLKNYLFKYWAMNSRKKQKKEASGLIAQKNHGYLVRDVPSTAEANQEKTAKKRRTSKDTEEYLS